MQDANSQKLSFDAAKKICDAVANNVQRVIQGKELPIAFVDAAQKSLAH